MKVKLWRRAFAASMSAVMLLGLTACGGSNESSDGIKTFTMFTAMPGSEINDDNDVMNIIAEKTGAKLKETWLTGQTDAEAIGTIIAGGEYPDFINGGDAMMSLYDAGVLVPWDDYLEKYPNLKEMYTDEEWDNFRQEDGKIYWANVFQNTYGEDRATTHNDEAFWIQARVLEWAGYPEIKTLDQYFDLLESYADANPTMANGTKNIPYTALCEDWRYFCIENAPQFLDGYPNDGSVIVDKDTMQVVDYNTTPTAKRYFQKLNEEYQKGYVDVEFATQTYDEYIAKLSTGAVLGMCDQWWDFAYNVNDVFKQQGLDEQGCNYVPLGLTIDEGMENRWHTYADTLNNSSGVAVTTSCSDIDAAFKFMNDLLDQEIHDLRFWGVEGEDYLVDENGLYYRTDEMRGSHLQGLTPVQLFLHAAVAGHQPGRQERHEVRAADKRIHGRPVHPPAESVCCLRRRQLRRYDRFCERRRGPLVPDVFLLRFNDYRNPRWCCLGQDGRSQTRMAAQSCYGA